MAAQRKQRNTPAEKTKCEKAHVCIEAEMRGVAVCVASLVKGAGSEGKDDDRAAKSHHTRLLQKKQFINEKHQI